MGSGRRNKDPQTKMTNDSIPNGKMLWKIVEALRSLEFLWYCYLIGKHHEWPCKDRILTYHGSKPTLTFPMICLCHCKELLFTSKHVWHLFRK